MPKLDVQHLSSTRLQGAAPPTWSASPTSTHSTPSWTTWSSSARSTAQWPARGRTRWSLKAQTLLLIHHSALDSTFTTLVCLCLWLGLSAWFCRGVCSCCQQVWSDHSNGSRYLVPVVRPALSLWVKLVSVWEADRKSTHLSVWRRFYMNDRECFPGVWISSTSKE